MSSWHVVKLEEVTSTPWRNGGGVTRELAAGPSADDWTWRMSVAEVGQSGPFSKFEGVDRWFAVLDGAGVQLDVAGKSYALTSSEPPFFFDGATPVDCRLLDGKTVDFNLMVRRGSASAHMQRVAGVFKNQIGATKLIAIYNRNTWAELRFEDENLHLPPASLAWRQVSAPTLVALTAGDALWMEISL